MKSNLKIGLFGMYGLYNYGCEAIVRGTYELIKQTWPESQVILYTSFPEEDQKIISDLDIIVKRVPLHNGKMIRRIANKALRSISASQQLPVWDAKSVAEECDIIFSVGGDIYTIPKYILDNKAETNYSSIIEFGKVVLKYKPLVIWGASIGPFGEKKEVKNYYFKNLQAVNQIFCREEKTYNYLKDNGVVENIQLCSDPAFYVKGKNSSTQYTKGNKTRIALNLSPLSIREQIGENTKSFSDKIIETIIELLGLPDTEIFLVPHVLSPLSSKDNDLTYLRDIYNMLPTNYHDAVHLLEDANGFLETKAFLQTCDLVIAARMHCAVNAVSEGTPTIFLYYSQKGIGMANYIYGKSDWAVPLTSIDKELKDKVMLMLSNQQAISTHIKQRIQQIRADESRIIDLFAKLV